MGSKISFIEYYLPDNIITNEQIEKEFPDYTSSKIEDKVGVRCRHVVSENQTAVDLAYEAGKKVLLNFDKNNIDFLILCSQSPDYFLPTSSCILQDKLGLRKNSGAFDFNLGCSGYIYGLAICKSLINTGIAKNILLITSETYSKHIHKKDKSNRTIFGDGASATIISACEKEHIHNFDLGTDGSGMNNLIVPNGGMRNKYNINATETDDNGSIRTDNNLFMNGPEIFNFTIKMVPACFEQTLQKNKLTIDDIKYVIFHQANKYILNYLKKKIKIPDEKFYLNMLDTGNTVSATIPIAIRDLQEKELITHGDKLILLGFGVGYSWGGVYIEF